MLLAIASARCFDTEKAAESACLANVRLHFGFVVPDNFENSTEEGLLSSTHHLVLLVDDDEDVRETSADMLEELGYSVLKAANAFEALEKLETFPHLEVMVTDVRMPGMTGLELSAIAGERYRDLRIILMSGYFTPQPIKCRFLQKPFRTMELDAAIRAELNGARAA